MPAAASPRNLRRLRQEEGWRGLVRQTHLSADQLVMPLFVRPGTHVRAPIAALPGQFQLSIDQLVKECRQLEQAGVPAVLLFGLADKKKDERASRAFARDGIIQRAVAALKQQVPGLLVITDVCLCAYTTHGHCGIIKKGPVIDAQATREALAKAAVSHAASGADMVAPSDMMDGSVRAIRAALDADAFAHLPIMAYAAKFASNLYAPFRTAVDSEPAFGDRRAYQLDVANSDEALHKAAADWQDGADIIMVKPALGFLDVVRRIKDTLRCPTAAFSVSGEYAMLKAASARGWLAERPVYLEMLLCMKRAGADVLITYWAAEAAKFLRGQR